MDIKQKKDGLQESGDPLVDGVIKAKAFVRKNNSLITVCCAALVVIVGGAFVYYRMKETNIRNAQEIFGMGVLEYTADDLGGALEAFREVVNGYRGTPTATKSAFMMGSIYLQQGEPDQAVTWFEAALNGPDAGFVKGQALEGIAAAYETKGDNAAAVRYLERALKDRSVAHRHAAIRWKLALLKRDSDTVAASALCRAIIADTLANAYHQRAENMLAVLAAAGK